MHSCECDTLELVRKAQLGDRNSLDRLAETVRVRLYEYVYRLTLQEDLSQDIVQETMLEMLRLFGKLRDTDRFWAWLHGIAFNKVRNHFGKQWRHKTQSLSQIGDFGSPAADSGRDLDRPSPSSSNEVLAEVVTDELKQIVLHCIRALEPRHRAILTMRCYDRMSYAEIGRLMDCSEIGARALFYRAKKALTKGLSKHGLGKGAVLMALVVFGKMTAATEAGAAEVSVTASTVSVGPLAATLATATSKVGIVTLTVATVVGVGSLGDWGSMLGGSSRRVDLQPEIPNAQAALAGRAANHPPSERWYYFPDRPQQAVMTRTVEYDDAGEHPVSLVLENQYANYHFDYRTNTVHIKNHRMWEQDLSVRRLPTDPPGLGEFLARIEGFAGATEPLAGSVAGRSSDGRGLLIMCRREAGGERLLREVDRHQNVLEEEYFQFGWPQSARRIDERDAVHRYGRAYFRITGQINGTTLSGTGRLPLVYAASRLHHPWLDLRLGQRLRAVDTSTGAFACDQEGRIIARYPSGSFFNGLARPWLGLHCVDTIRRDAARQELAFQTQYDARAGHATILVESEPTTLTYTIDMEKDLVERLELNSSQTSNGRSTAGELTFTYFPDDDSTEARFPEPRIAAAGAVSSGLHGMLWLLDVLEMRDGSTP